MEIKDDGKGIEVEKLRKKIVANGLLPENVAKELSKDLVIEFIFLDDVSTKDEVTEVSGRGVGLAAVKNEIQKADGTIHVESELGQGTRFVIDVPKYFRLWCG